MKNMGPYQLPKQKDKNRPEAVVHHYPLRKKSIERRTHEIGPGIGENYWVWPQVLRSFASHKRKRRALESNDLRKEAA